MATHEKTLYEADCVGGPMDGKPAHSRFPEGFLLIHPDKDLVWIYDYDTADDKFTCREHMPVDLDKAKAWTTAEQARYDVQAFDPETMAA